jgi:hypothetical protein
LERCHPALIQRLFTSPSKFKDELKTWEPVSKRFSPKSALICSISRKAKILTTGIHVVFRGLKFEPDAEIGQISADFEMGRFGIGSW